ncbi:unnamed protein product [Brassica oleracea]
MWRSYALCSYRYSSQFLSEYHVSTTIGRSDHRNICRFFLLPPFFFLTHSTIMVVNIIYTVMSLLS